MRRSITNAVARIAANEIHPARRSFAKSDWRFTPKKPASKQREQRRNERAGQVNRVCAEWLQENRRRENKIIERRSCMRSCPCREVLELVMAYDQSRMFRAHPHARHSRITIGIREIDVSRDKNVLIICAACRQDQQAENSNFNDV